MFFFLFVHCFSLCVCFCPLLLSSLSLLLLFLHWMAFCALVPLVTSSLHWTGLGVLAPTVWLQTIMPPHQRLKGTSLWTQHHPPHPHPNSLPAASCSHPSLFFVVSFPLLHRLMIKPSPPHSTPPPCCTLLFQSVVPPSSSFATQVVCEGATIFQYLMIY